MKWETVIGLEVHVQLLTKSKIFSGASTAFGAEPNTQACAIDLGFPGVLPVLNKEVVNMAIQLGLGIHGEIAPHSLFARKNYFYPDLPKGYQISQYEFPIIKNGYLDIPLENDSFKRIKITRAHLEEDAGKSLHEHFQYMSGIDLNRAGTPLLEIVSEPDLRSAKEAVTYLKTLHSLVCYLKICDGNMQHGSFRCDANVSIRPKGATLLGTRVELKNLNSFRFIEKAIEFEVERQITLLEEGDTVTQETRLYNPDKNETRSMRSKEEANDYRYFPDPDLLPIVITEHDIAAIRAELPELPQQKYQRFIEQYGLNPYDSAILISTPEIAQYFEQTTKSSGNQAKLAANWIIGELSAALNRHDFSITESPVTAEQLGILIARITDNTISGKIAKTIFDALWDQEGDVDTIIDKRGLKQITDSNAVDAIVDKILATNPTKVAEYQSGKTQLFGFFVGLAMKESGGKINPKQVNEILKLKLEKNIS
ncbi:MAG: Asp-tRNA(Asn)/Glu-tRNA(Gln) amidotransferase subunit GatB [Gammaproteobacteria bacterium]|nr:Asp-tRNA(Asn)/Glu-tRNA(Gln) amidotransferase subunit GatB [Gammaproteobacteria bacterium]